MKIPHRLRRNAEDRLLLVRFRAKRKSSEPTNKWSANLLHPIWRVNRGNILKEKDFKNLIGFRGRTWESGSSTQQDLLY